MIAVLLTWTILLGMLIAIQNTCKILCTTLIVLCSYSSFAKECGMHQAMIAIANTSSSAVTINLSAKHQDNQRHVVYGDYSVAPGEYSTVCLPNQSKITEISACAHNDEDICLYQTVDDCPNAHEPIGRILIGTEFPPII